MAIGNTFGSKEFHFGHAKKVWREIRHRFPGGGTIKNLSAWSGAKVIPSGTPVLFDDSDKTVTAYTDAQIKAEGFNGVINGYTQEDVVVKNASVATATVVYAGELYKYMYDDDVLAVLLANEKTPQITFVQ